MLTTTQAAATFPKQDWTPRRRGAIYCSPACGGNCTYADYLAAIKASHKLAAGCGAGYTAHVWENLGWHHEAKSPDGRIQVHPSHEGTQYTASVGDGSYWGLGGTPKAAINQALDVAKSHIRKLQALIEGL